MSPAACPMNYAPATKEARAKGWNPELGDDD